LLVMGLMAGCATPGFDRDYRRAVAEYAAGGAEGIEGPWEGRWLSEGSGHEGRLRCLVRAEEGEEGRHEFRYWASWGKIFRGTFPVQFPVEKRLDGSYGVTGEASLGRWGSYRQEGEVREGVFEARYEAMRERGVMEMARPE
jgi:hypothetical protein